MPRLIPVPVLGHWLLIWMQSGLSCREPLSFMWCCQDGRRTVSPSHNDFAFTPPSSSLTSIFIFSKINHVTGWICFHTKHFCYSCFQCNCVPVSWDIKMTSVVLLLHLHRKLLDLGSYITFLRWPLVRTRIIKL